MATTDRRSRNWSFILYPESAPENWVDILDEYHTPWFQSPLHDKDLNPTGEEKKAHWHIILCYEGNKSYSQICELTSKLNGTYPQIVENVRGYVRYFCHLDNPEKHQYDIKDIISHQGADLQEFLKPSSSSRYRYIADMLHFIRDYNVTEFMDFMLIAEQSHYDDWFPLLCDNSAVIIKEAIRSNRHSFANKHQQLAYNAQTGEVVEEIL